MRKVLSVLVCILLTIPALATGDATPTSKGYVDAQMATLQDNLPGAAANTVVTTTDTAGETGTKAIYDSTGNYVTQQDALVTAEDANTAIQMAINGELVCREYDPTGQYCYVYDVRHAIQSLLPAGYTALEYIESTGTQHIDTGVGNWNNTLEIETKLSIQEQDSGTRTYFGAWDVWNSSGHTIPGITTYTSYRPVPSFQAGNPTAAGTNIGITNGQTGIYSLKGDSISWSNGTSVAFNRGDTFTMNTNIVLFACNKEGGKYVSEYSKFKLYYFKIWLNDLLVRNFIPARRNNDDEVGLYDLVTEQFFTNAGTGNFVAGPDLNVYLPSGN